MRIVTLDTAAGLKAKMSLSKVFILDLVTIGTDLLVPAWKHPQMGIVAARAVVGGFVGKRELHSVSNVVMALEAEFLLHDVQ